MKVLLTGATGFVGKVLTQALLESHAVPDIEDTSVRALVRDPGSASAQALRSLPYADGNLELVRGDILDPTSLAEALDDGAVDAVIHLVGIIAERRGEGVTFQRIHDLGTRNVVNATHNAGIDRYVHMSAMGPGPDRKAVYHQTKWAAEEYVRASGLDFTIFRPSIVYGIEDLFINRFAFFVRKKIFGVPLPNFGRTKFQPVAVEDVAEAFAQALENRKSIGKTYDLGGPNVVTLREIITSIEDILGTSAPKIPIPLGLAKLQAMLLQFAPYPFDLNPDQVTMMEQDNVGDTSNLTADFEIELTPFKEGIAASLIPQRETFIPAAEPEAKPQPKPQPAPKAESKAKPEPKPEPKPEAEAPAATEEPPKEEPPAEESAKVDPEELLAKVQDAAEVKPAKSEKKPSDSAAPKEEAKPKTAPAAKKPDAPAAKPAPAAGGSPTGKKRRRKKKK